MRLFLSFLTLPLLAGCGAAPSVDAPREQVQALELRAFPKQSWRLTNNKFFLWREDMTPEQASQAQAIGRDIDDLDGRALPLNGRRLDLEKQIDPLKERVRLLNGYLRPVKLAFDKVTKKVAASQKSLGEKKDLLAAEEQKPTPDPAVIASLKTQIAGLESDIKARQEELADLKPVKEKFERDIADDRKALEPLQADLAVVETQSLDIELQGRKRVDEIMGVVDWFKDQPTSVVFQFEADGSITSSISSWNLGDDAGPRNFSTRAAEGRKPTMGNVTYTEKGGVFTFDVYVFTDETQRELRETYAFRVARIKYDHPDGRIFFGGDIVKTSVVEGQQIVRRGVAKLVDRNN